MKNTLWPVVLVTLLTAGPASAAVPTTLSYAGFLENGGTPYTGNMTAVFELYRDATGGAAIWTETFPSITVAAGVFAVELGLNQPLNFTILNGTPVFLSVTLNGTTLAPRSPMRSVPYARRAELADGTPWTGVTGISTGAGLDLASGTNQLSVNTAFVTQAAQNVCLDSPAEAVAAIANQNISPSAITTPAINATTVTATNLTVTTSARVPAPVAPGDAVTKAYADAQGCVWSGAESAFSACSATCSSCGTASGMQTRGRNLVCAGGAAQRVVTAVQLCTVDCGSCGN
jgi:hypothetical protein